jgi:hypothetical protein
MLLHQLYACSAGLKRKGISVTEGVLGERFRSYGVCPYGGANGQDTPPLTTGRERDKGIRKECQAAATCKKWLVRKIVLVFLI